MGENDKKPRLRFKGFTNSWEQRKLGDICNVLVGGEAPKDSIRCLKPHDDYKYPIFSNGLGENSLWGYSKNYRIAEPAITFSSIGTLGFPELRNAYFTPIIRLKVILPKEKQNNLFYLKENIARSDFSNNSSGIPNINAEAVKSINIIFTVNFQEQEKIGTLLQQLDNLITLHQRKYEKLKNIKKAMMGQMFA